MMANQELCLLEIPTTQIVFVIFPVFGTDDIPPQLTEIFGVGKETGHFPLGVLIGVYVLKITSQDMR